VEAQTPAPTPDLSFVKDLEPGVAYAVLFVIALGIVAFYLGPGIKARFTPKIPEPAKPVEAATAQHPAQAHPATSLPAAMDRADILSQQFLDHVLRQLRDAEVENERLVRENRDLRFELDRARWHQRGMQ
jgi:hypothetical protein